MNDRTLITPRMIAYETIRLRECEVAGCSIDGKKLTIASDGVLYRGELNPGDLALSLNDFEPILTRILSEPVGLADKAALLKTGDAAWLEVRR